LLILLFNIDFIFWSSGIDQWYRHRHQRPKQVLLTGSFYSIHYFLKYQSAHIYSEYSHIFLTLPDAIGKHKYLQKTSRFPGKSLDMFGQYREIRKARKTGG